MDMKKWFRPLSYVLVAMLTAALTLGGVFYALSRQPEPQVSKLDVLEQLILDNFIGEADKTVLEDAAAKGTKFDYPVSWGCDLQTEHERYLTEKHFGQPVFVTDYPAEIKAFYMRLNDDGKTVAATDCLVPGIGEIIGGSQREERLDVLERRITELGMDVEQYRYYVDLRRFGGCHHAGFGLGFERLVMYLTGVSNIRDVLPHPRTVGNAEF
jgi:asparaginyl-tRNA synthetase